MKLVVGCPVHERAWILPAWLEHLRDWKAEIELVFVVTPGVDDTVEIINDISWAPVHTFEMLEGTHSTERNWGDRDRLDTLVACREALRREAAVLEPDLFFSVDSDILVEPGSLPTLLEALAEYDAVSPLVYLSEHGDVITNAFYYDRHVPRRVKVYNALQPADVLCAAVLMKGEVLRSVEYEYDRLGEDFGWSRNAKERGFKLGIDTGVKFKHVMSKEKLHVTDERIGW